MTQEDKELLIKDLCARLPYGVKMNHIADDEINPLILIGIARSMITLAGNGGFASVDIEEYKPYLFPLSSMTEEQKGELKNEMSKQIDILIERVKNDDCGIDCGKYHFHSLLELEWCIKNHFDYRGLIPKGLAIDATNENIY